MNELVRTRKKAATRDMGRSNETHRGMYRVKFHGERRELLHWLFWQLSRMDNSFLKGNTYMFDTYFKQSSYLKNNV